MKAIRIHQYGGPEVLQMEEVPRPVPAADEILVKIHASGVNPVDWVIRSGTNEGFTSFLQLPLTPGWDAAGLVEACGSSVTDFKAGDAVYGIPAFPGDGSYAEYCVAKASQFAFKPRSLGFTEAAAVPLAALTAWSGLFANGNLKSGERVFIQGASGGVGSYAVQFAKSAGAYVIATAGSSNLNYLKELGADEVIDYRTQTFEELLQDLDLVLECSPVRDNNERIKAVQVIKQEGRFVSVNLDYPFDDLTEKAFLAKGVTGKLAANQPRQDWLQTIALLIDEGKVKVHLSKVFPFNDVAAAHRESESWHVRGKLVLEIIKEAPLL
jgi:NADPH:quinone reductase-like Zn-dependent oxidoreductase